jgi:hypothetical protein
MAKKATVAAKPASKSSRWGFKHWLLGFLVLAALVAVPFYQARQLISWAVNHLYGPNAIFQTGLASPFLGGVRASQVIISTEGTPIRMDQITVEMPLTHFLANAYTLGALKPDLRYAKISYQNIQNPDGFAFANINPLVGSRSSALGESLGCDDVSRLTETHFTAMGLSPGATQLVARFDINRSELTQSITLTNQGLGVADIVNVGESRSASQQLMQTPELPSDIVWKSVSLRLTDQGFVTARNNFCAGKIAGNTAQYLAWNLASVNRLAASAGFRISPKMRAIYQDYATHGGEINANFGFSKELTSADFKDTPLSEWVAHVGGDMRRNGLFVQSEFERQEKLDLPESGTPLTVYQQLIKDRFVPEPVTLSKPEDLRQLIASAQNANTTVVTATVKKRLSSEVYLLPAFDTAQPLSFAQISGQVGRRVRIDRAGREPVYARVLGAGKRGVRLRVEQAGGFVEMEMTNQGFIRAFLLPRR